MRLPGAEQTGGDPAGAIEPEEPLLRRSEEGNVSGHSGRSAATERVTPAGRLPRSGSPRQVGCH